MWVAIGWAVFWRVRQFDMLDLPTLERQTYAIVTGIKELFAIALYIAWRVTPESK